MADRAMYPDGFGPSDLPPELKDRYAFKGILNEGGLEAACLLVVEISTGKEFFLKWYRRGFTPDGTVLERIKADGDRSNVVKVVDFSAQVGNSWEIQEYCPYGTIASGIWAKMHPLPLDDAMLREVLVQASEAIHHLHHVREGMLHRDVKPSNILIRSLDPFDLVLGDFGFSRAGADVTRDASQRVGTPAYQAPEVYDGILTAKSDWFSLGSIVYELLTGTKLFSGEEAEELGVEAACRSGMYRERILRLPSSRWQLLLKGLLTYEHRRRWGYAEVKEWLDGGYPPIFEQGWVVAHVEGVYQVPGTGVLAYTPEELTASLCSEWQNACKLLAGRERPRMVRFLRRFDYAQEAANVLESRDDPDRLLVALQAALLGGQDGQDGRILFRGIELGTASLFEQIESARRGDEQALSWLCAVRDKRILSLWSLYTGNADVSRAGARLEEWRCQAQRALDLIPEDEELLREAGGRSFDESAPELFELAFEED